MTASAEKSKTQKSSEPHDEAKTVVLGALATALVPPDRLSDRLLTSGVITEQNPTSLSEKPLLAYIFEVKKAWFPGSNLFATIIETLQKEAAKITLEKEIDVQFESLLKQVNISLNQVSETGETEWIGSFNGLIMLLAENELHFSQTGRIPAYILQSNRIRQITDDTVDSEPHPLKTFANIASGALEIGDRILFANQELYSEISLDALRRILGSNSPLAASDTIAIELKKQKNPGATLVAIQTGELDQLKAESSSLTTLEAFEPFHKRFWRTSKPAREVIQRGAAVTLATTAAVAVATYKITKKASKAAQTRFFPSKPETAKEATSENDLGEQPTKSRPIIELIRPVGAPVQEIETPLESPIGSIIPASEFAMEDPEYNSELQNAPITRPHTTKSAAILITTSVTKYAKRFLKFLKVSLPKFIKWIQIQKNQRITALGLALILVLSVGWGIMGHRSTSPSSNSNKSSIDSNLASVEAAVAEIQSLAASQNTKAALEKSGEATTILYGLTGLSDSQKEIQKNLWTSLNKAVDPLAKTTRLSTSTFYSFTTKPSAFAGNLPFFYGFVNGGTDVIRTGAGNPTAVQATTPIGTSADVASAITRSADGNSAAFVLSRQGDVFRVSQLAGDTKVRKIQPVEGKFVTGDVIASYADNLYILDGRGGLLWKYAGSGTSYQKGLSIIDVNKINLRETISMTVDGQLYFLKKDGSVVKVASNKLDPNFAIRGLPEGIPAMTRPLEIITGEGFQSVYVLDGGSTSSELSSASVYEFTKNGDYVRRYAFGSTITDVRGFDINQKEKKLWILSGKDILEYSL